MTRRVTCLVPFCRHTRGDRKNDPLPADVTGLEWICAAHWRAIPRLLRAVSRRAERDYLRAREARDVAATAIRTSGTPRPRAISDAWHAAGLRHQLAAARADRIWSRCKRKAIEAAGGLA